MDITIKVTDVNEPLGRPGTPTSQDFHNHQHHGYMDGPGRHGQAAGF